MTRSPSLAAAVGRLSISSGGYVFDPQSGESYSVNESGREILRRLGAGMAVPDICRELAALYAEDARFLEPVVDAFARDVARRLA